MLEECGLPYRVHKVDIGAGAQFAPDYLRINPNGKIPSIVDPDGPEGKPISMMESGAILVYLAAKAGRLLPASGRGKYKALEWLMFQMGGVGPMFGQVHHFLRAAKEPVPYAIERYTKEKDRLYGVLDRRLAEVEYLAGEYSIADVAAYPWVARHEWHRTDLDTRSGAAWPFLSTYSLRALRARKALISSTRSCGSSGGWRLPTTRFIHSMFFCMRATTSGHSAAVCRRGSGSTWHCWQASRKDRASGRFTGVRRGSSGRWAFFCR
jgi:GST-like protein